MKQVTDRRNCMGGFQQFASPLVVNVTARKHLQNLAGLESLHADSAHLILGNRYQLTIPRATAPEYFEARSLAHLLRACGNVDE